MCEIGPLFEILETSGNAISYDISDFEAQLSPQFNGSLEAFYRMNEKIDPEAIDVNRDYGNEEDRFIQWFLYDSLEVIGACEAEIITLEISKTPIQIPPRDRLFEQYFDILVSPTTCHGCLSCLECAEENFPRSILLGKGLDNFFYVYMRVMGYYILVGGIPIVLAT